MPVYTMATGNASEMASVPALGAPTDGPHPSLNTMIEDQNIKMSHFHIDVNECSDNQAIVFTARHGTIRGFSNKYNTTDTTKVCLLQIHVRQGMYIRASSKVTHTLDKMFCATTFVSRSSLRAEDEQYVLGFWTSQVGSAMPILLTPKHVLVVKIATKCTTFHDFWLRFVETYKNLRTSFKVKTMSELNGYITLHGFDENLSCANGLRLSYTLHLLRLHVVMLSFSYIKFETQGECADYFLELFSSIPDGQQRKLWRKCMIQNTEVSIYNVSLVFRISSGYRLRESFLGFKALYSFHTYDHSPKQLVSGRFNCSRHYETFRHHLDCNLRVECENQEDETGDCPYSSARCKGAVQIKNRCVSYGLFDPKDRGYKSWNSARKVCQANGGDLVSIKTPQELRELIHTVRLRMRTACAYIGLQKASFFADNIYRKTWRWIDSTTCYHASFPAYSQKFNVYRDVCSSIREDRLGVIYPTPCLHHSCDSFLCETHTPAIIPNAASLPKLARPTDTKSNTKSVFAKCPGGHVVHDFLSCDVDSHCRVHEYSTRCENSVYSLSGSKGEREDSGQEDTPLSVEMFQCREYTVHYTLVCDFRNDCADSSDEKFCKHKENKENAGLFRCSSGQQVPKINVCDFVSDCQDSSDEADCQRFYMYFEPKSTRIPPPVIIHMDGRGDFTQTSMDANEVCPETHFRCPDPVHCLPVFLRCNGVKDCPYGEDELSCQVVTCPKYYRCRGSSVCLHPSHVCDGWPQCPQRDDELLCNATCPSVCQCQGLAFVCHQPFPARKYPDLRYLDADSSGMTPFAVSDCFYIIHLRLSHCGISTWPETDLQNLRILDLSENKIVTVGLRAFETLENLKVLILKRNPLYVLTLNTSQGEQRSLLVIDLSFSRLQSFDSKVLRNFISVETVNLSFSSIRTVSSHGLQSIPKLKELDLRGCAVEQFPYDLYSGLQHVRSVQADNYRLCCKDFLPDNFNDNFCHAPQDDISSCEDLFTSKIHRYWLWLVGLLCITGNSGLLISNIIRQGERMQYCFKILLSGLNVSNGLMGLYLMIVLAADYIYRGEYIWRETAWKNSPFCEIAGFVHFLSNKVSAFMICLITVDRFLVLHFPFSTFRFKGRSAALASALAWFCGFVLAAVPLLPALSHWRFYGHTGICIPLQATNKLHAVSSFSFGVIVVSFILSISTGIGQMYIYWSIKTNSLQRTGEWTSLYQDLYVARRLMAVVVSDLLYLFLSGVLGLMALIGTHVPGKVNVAMAFLFPVNSAINPFLYTFNTLMERRRQAREARLLQILNAHATARGLRRRSH